MELVSVSQVNCTPRLLTIRAGIASDGVVTSKMDSQLPGKGFCRVSWKAEILALPVIRPATSASLVSEDDQVLISRLMHLGLYPRPSGDGLAGTVVSRVEIGPTWTFQLQQTSVA
jgi:hypothetical protein